MLNGQQLAFELLKPHASAFGADLRPELKVVSILRLPLITFRLRLGSAVNDGGMDSPIAWGATLDISWFGEDEQAVFDMAAAGYDFLHEWNNPFRGASAIAPGVGHVSQLTDRSAPDLAGVADIKGHTTVQYAGGFDLIAHEARPDPTD